MEGTQMRISQKFDHTGSGNIRIRSAPRLAGLRAQSLQQGSRSFYGGPNVPRTTLASAQNLPPPLSRGRSSLAPDQSQRFNNVARLNPAFTVVRKQEEFIRAQRAKENLEPNSIRQFFDQ